MASRDEKLRDMTRVAEQLNVSSLSWRQYWDNGGNYTEGQIFSDGHKWEDLCKELGLDSDRRNKPVTDEEYLRRLKEFYDREGRVPNTSEIRLARLGFGKSRWPTLKAFLAFGVEQGTIPARALKKPYRIDETGEPTRDAAVTQRPENQDSSPGRERTPPPIPPGSKKKWQRIDEPGFPYAPTSEAGVVALFAILCSHGKLPFQLVEITGGKGIDSTCWDERSKEHVSLEFKYKLRENSRWNHSIKDLHMVVCWNNEWPGFPKEVIALSARYPIKT